MTLPVIADQSSAHRPALADSAISSTPAVQARSLSGLRVLVVDDEADTLELLRTILVESGAEVTTAPSADLALRALQQRPQHVLISDIGMPGCDGYELIHAVRRSHDANIRAAALTAYARPEDRARALSAGYEAHIAKPVEPLMLIDAVARLVGRDIGHGDVNAI